MSTQENIRRMIGITDQAGKDCIDPTEYVRRAIQSAIGSSNPFIGPGDPFVVMSIDGFDGSMFPCGSSTTVEQARQLAKKKIDEEPLYSDRDEVSTTFHVFTRDGVHIPLEDTKPSP